MLELGVRSHDLAGGSWDPGAVSLGSLELGAYGDGSQEPWELGSMGAGSQEPLGLGARNCGSWNPWELGAMILGKG